MTAKFRVLIVEDSPTLISQIESMLPPNGYLVYTARDESQEDAG